MDRQRTDPKALQREVESIRWWHRIDLGHGVVTPGVDDTPAKLAQIDLPQDLAGLSVLDVGAWDGFFSFEAERRGAARVLAVDSYSWDGGGWGSKAAFDLARRTLDSSVESRRLEVLEISPETVGEFDLVLFLGVLYHMRHPLLALERVASVTRGRLILETQVEMVTNRTPIMVFYPGNELRQDSTNWWAPNPPAVTAMLRACGFTRVETVALEVHGGGFLRPARAVLNRVRRKTRLFETQPWGRMVVHAWK